jgi:hypothetical protein
MNELKQTQNFMKIDKMWRIMLLMFTIIALSAGTFSCDDDDDDDKDNNTKRNYTISGNASGNQMVPANDASGTGTITGTYNPNTRVLAYTTTWTDLTGAPVAGGFYNGVTGENGSIVGSAWTFDSNATENGTRTGTMTLTEAQEEDLLSGDWYYLLTTDENEGGEIRGQIVATQVPNG